MTSEMACDVIPTGLYNRGLIYLIIPIADQDTIVVPPLQVVLSILMMMMACMHS